MASPSHSQTPVAAGTLKPVLSAKYALRWEHAVVCLCLAGAFLYFSYVPLSHVEVWRHAALGQWMLEHGSLPAADPLLPLAEGMHFVPTAWLGEVVLAQVQQWGGAAALSFTLALTTLASLLLFSRAMYLQTGRKRLVLAGLALVLGLGWAEMSVLSPSVFGLLCLATLFWMISAAPEWQRGNEQCDASTSPPRYWWWAMPLLFALWANLDASFLVGLVVLACHVMGRAIDVGRERGLLAIASDRWFRRWVWLAELSLAATLIHPLGWNLWAEVIRLQGNAFWQAAGGFRPLALASITGLSLAVALIALVVLLRVSRAPVRGADVLLVGCGVLAVACNPALIVWFGLIAAWVAMPYAGEIAARTWAPRREVQREEPELEPGEDPPPLPLGKFAFTLVCVLVIWSAFALSPASTPLFGGTPRSDAQLHSARTPRGVSRYLREHPPQGLVWATADWGDWLAWDGPPGIQVYANSGFAQLPRQVRFDYGGVNRGEGGWERVLDRYDVQLLVVDKTRQERLATAVLRSDVWTLTYEDDQALVLIRRDS